MAQQVKSFKWEDLSWDDQNPWERPHIEDNAEGAEAGESPGLVSQSLDEVLQPRISERTPNNKMEDD